MVDKMDLRTLQSKETELQNRYNAYVLAIKNQKSRFSRGRNLSSVERLTIAMTISQMEDNLLRINREMRMVWLLKQMFVNDTNPSGATRTDYQREDTADSSLREPHNDPSSSNA